MATLFFFGNPKAGSTWLGGLMAGISIEMGLNIFYGQYSLPGNFEQVKKGVFDIVISQSSSYQKLQELNIPYRGFHVIRDPRDICVSSYFSYKKTHEIGEWYQLGELRDKLNRKSFEEGMFDIFDFNKCFFEQMALWNYNDPNILELRFENIIQDTERFIVNICRFLGLNNSLKYSDTYKIRGIINRVLYRRKWLYDKFRISQIEIPEERIQEINKNLSFKELSHGRMKGTENTSSHYRKGISGDWKKYYNSDLKSEFKNRYGDLLVRLGYDQDKSW